MEDQKRKRMEEQKRKRMEDKRDSGETVCLWHLVEHAGGGGGCASDR